MDEDVKANGGTYDGHTVDGSRSYVDGLMFKDTKNTHVALELTRHLIE